MTKVVLKILILILVFNANAQVIEEVSTYKPYFNLGTAELNGKLVYFGSNGTNKSIVFTDGTFGGTTEVFVPEIAEGYPDGFTEYNNKVYFSAAGVAGDELWVTDGTVVGTYMVKDIDSTGNSYPRELIVFNGFLYFTAATDESGVELWRSDGTSLGTVMVKDIVPGNGSSNPSDLIVFNNELYFIAYTPSTGYELWKSNGSTVGTSLLKDINTNGSQGSSIRNFYEHQGKLYFRANNGYEGVELYATDGTELGTEIAADIASGNTSSNPSAFYSFGENLFFNASIPSAEYELFWYNSQNGNTSMLDFNLTGSSYASVVGNFNNVLIIIALTEDGVYRLFTFDWSTGITEELIDLDIVVDTYLKPLMLNGKLFFLADDGTNGTEMWCTDGTAAQTYKVTPAININNSPLGGVGYLVSFNSAIYFEGSYSTNGKVLCKVYYPSLGFEEVHEDVIRIFPNPATELVTIELKETQTIEIVDIVGNSVLKTEVEKGTHDLDVSTFESGTYFIRGNSFPTSKKFVIN